MRRFVLCTACALACLAPAGAARADAARAESPCSVVVLAARGEAATVDSAGSGAKVEQKVPEEVARVLEKMEKAGEAIRTLRARFDYELNQTLYEDIQKREGRLAYAAPNRLRFEFTDRPKETFVFDGRVVYHVKPSTRQLILWEMRTADEAPVETLALGKTPFPLPFGQKKASVLKHFRVGRDEEAEQKDPKKRRVLALVPKEGTTLAQDYTRILLWIDTERWMPTRARLLDTSENITTVDFHPIETNVEVADEEFARPEVPGDWEVVEHRKADEQK